MGRDLARLIADSRPVWIWTRAGIDRMVEKRRVRWR
jgi:hypothetical protein